MKRLKLMIAVLTGFTVTSFAQQKAVQKVIIQTPTVQCEMCKEKIEKYLSREPGVSSVKVDYKKKTTSVSFFSDRNNVEQVKTAIANVGYDADDITAEPAAYNKLPKCCKKPTKSAPLEPQLH